MVTVRASSVRFDGFCDHWQATKRVTSTMTLYERERPTNANTTQTQREPVSRCVRNETFAAVLKLVCAEEEIQTRFRGLAVHMGPRIKVRTLSIPQYSDRTRFNIAESSSSNLNISLGGLVALRGVFGHISKALLCRLCCPVSSKEAKSKAPHK